MAKMQSFSRIFICGAGLLLASVGGIALIAVINTWRLYSLPVAMTIAFGFVTAFVFVSGIVFLAIAIRGKVPSRRRATGLGYIPRSGSLGWKSKLVSYLALVALVASLVVGGVGGGGIRLILGFTGAAGVIVYTVLKVLSSRVPRFLKRKKIFVASLSIVVIGVAVASTGGYYDILGQSSQLAIDLETIGTVIFVLGILGIMLTLVSASRDKIS